MKTNLITFYSFILLALFSCKSTGKLVENSENDGNKENIERIETVLYVAHRFGDCFDGTPDKCLYVKQFLNEEWKAVREISEEFEYIPGVEHRISVSMNSDYSDIVYKETITRKDLRNREPITELNDVWSLYLLADRKMEFEKNEAPTLMINLIDNKLQGTAFCMDIRGMVQADSPENISMRIDGQPTSACEEEEESMQALLMDCLSNVNRFKIENGELMLYVNDKLLLGYKKKF